MKTYDFIAGEVLLIDKPLTWTSFDAVNKIRWMLKQKLGVKLKVGHAGTLDPLATGLLIICTGKQTKNIDQYQAQEKEYTGTFVVGATTPCYDLEKEVDHYFAVNHIRQEAVDVAVKSLTGEIDQIPPIFSAIQVEGKRSYDKARAGTAVELPPRRVTISEFEISAFRQVENESHPEKQVLEFDFRVVCSKGTYIRSLARDFGLALGSGAYLRKLVRTRIGNFKLEGAMSIEQFQAILG